MTAVFLRKRLYKLLDGITKLIRTGYTERQYRRGLRLPAFNASPSIYSPVTLGKFHNLCASISSSITWDDNNSNLLIRKAVKCLEQRAAPSTLSFQVY